MIIVGNTYINGEPRIIVRSGTHGRKVVRDGIVYDVAVDDPGEDVNYTESEDLTAEEIVAAIEEAMA